jgi:hypothetical protein
MARIKLGMDVSVATRRWGQPKSTYEGGHLWMVGSGSVTLQADRPEITVMSSTAPGWKVRGLSAGSAMSSVNHAFPQARTTRGCGASWAGAPIPGLVAYRTVRGQTRYTLFAQDQSGSKVWAVWVGSGRLHDTGC